jgi:hypothetical protein
MICADTNVIIAGLAEWNEHHREASFRLPTA